MIASEKYVKRKYNNFHVDFDVYCCSCVQMREPLFFLRNSTHAIEMFENLFSCGNQFMRGLNSMLLVFLFD